MIRRACLIALASWLGALVPGGGAHAVEGKWTPQQILEHDPKWLAELGLEIPPEKLWSKEGAGLLDAAVNVGGCSAGFVSAEGLLITNHHCAFSILQQHSTPERDLITNGFLAASRAEELSGAGVRATIPHRTTDVTAAVEAAVPAGADDLARFHAIERTTKEMVAACERTESRRCQVAAFDGGVSYQLVEMIEYPDVRLVWAPPLGVGEYGGEVDNWSWPRHTGDVALLRVYAAADGRPAPAGQGTVPYRPRHWFPVSAKGVAPGQFVMLAGYPGATVRSLTAAEMRERADLFHPRRAELYRAWIDLMEKASATGEEARIALADRMKSLANREKNSRGQVAGIRRGRILEKKEAAEREVLAWAGSQPERRATLEAVEARTELGRLVETKRRTWDRDFLLEHAKQGPKSLELALTVVRWAAERAKPDLEREPEYMERNRERLTDRLRRDQKRLHGPTEEALLADLAARAAALPEGARIEAFAPLVAGGADGLRARVAELHARTKVTDLDERTKMLGETVSELRDRRDPLLDLAFALDRELLAHKEREDREKGTISRLRPAWQRAVIAHAGKPVAPDANGTLRVTLAHVQGYGPRDGMWMEPQTTVAGVVEKHTGEAPFDAPDALLAAAPRAPESRFADPKLGDVPVGFLADADTTGGNSGSPVVDGRGQLVGVNFDRVWENVANDFGFNPEVARNVSVDVRYLLWLLEALCGEAARPLFLELGVGAP